VHAETRAAAIARASAALRDFPILGVRTNVPYLLAVLAHPAFGRGDVDTRFLDRETPAIVAAMHDAPAPDATFVAAAAAFLGGVQAGASGGPSGGGATAPPDPDAGDDTRRRQDPWDLAGPWIGA
jgi:acetyl/propionyl-CoA carboxylase alpha subunit